MPVLMLVVDIIVIYIMRKIHPVGGQLLKLLLKQPGVTLAQNSNGLRKYDFLYDPYASEISMV
jgi:hypothetical protein